MTISEGEGLASPAPSFSGPSEFAEAIRLSLQTAARDNWPELWLCDADFADWPLGERAVIESLNAWAHSRRTLHLYARHYRKVQSKHHRFVRFRVQWQHIVKAWQAPSVGEGQFPSLILGKDFVLQRTNVELSRGICEQGESRARACQQWMAEVHDRASAGFAAQVLGL